MNSNPLVSIIIPVYDIEPFFPKFLKHAFGQTYKNIEYIFIDDCTPDNSMAILEETMKQYPELQDRITILHQEKNSGCCASRRFALQYAKGDYILPMDADDWCKKTMVEKMVKAAVKNDADIVVCNYYRGYDHWNIPDGEKSYKDRSRLLWELFREKNLHGYLWNKMIRRSLWVHPEVKWPAHDMQEDLILSAQFLFLASKVCFIRNRLYYYRRNNSRSITRLYRGLESILINRMNLYYQWKDKGMFEGYEEGFLERAAAYANHINRDEFWEKYPELIGYKQQ